MNKIDKIFMKPPVRKYDSSDESSDESSNESTDESSDEAVDETLEYMRITDLIDVKTKTTKKYLSLYTNFRNASETKKALMIFAIYDYKITDEWGAASDIIRNMCKTLVFNGVVNHRDSISYNVYEPALQVTREEVIYCKFRIYIDTLINFLTLSEKTECICEFGTTTHATALYIKKYEEFINIVHINTGYGLDKSHSNIMIGDVYYWDIFSSIYIKNNVFEIIKFVQFISPFIIYMYCKVNNLNSVEYHKYLNSKHLIPKHLIPDNFVKNNLKEFYEYFYDEIYNADNDNNYFLQLGKVFKGIDVPFEIINPEGISNNIQNMLIKLINEINEKNRKNTKETPQDIFLYKAYSTIIGIVDNNKAYFLDQKGGTCTYRSALFAWLYHCCSIYEASSINVIFTYFENFCFECYEEVEKIKYIFDNNYIVDSSINVRPYIINENINLNLLIEYLIEDGIIDGKYSYINRDKINYNEPFTIKLESMKLNIVKFFRLMPRDSLDDVVYKIRTKNISPDEIHNICWEHNDPTLIINDMGMITYNTIKEETFLLSLYECYNNNIFAETYTDIPLGTGKYQIPTNICMKTGRINLIEHEEIWIARYITYINKNPARVKTSALGKLWYDTLDTQNNDSIRLHYSDETTRLKHIYQSLIFNDDVVSKASFVNFDIFDMNLLTIKKILINFIKNNSSTINFHKNTFIGTIDLFICFIIDNIDNLGIKIAKYAMISIYKFLCKRIESMNSNASNIYNLYRKYSHVFFKKYIFEKPNRELIMANGKIKWGCIFHKFNNSDSCLYVEDIDERYYINIESRELSKLISNILNKYSDYDEVLQVFNNYDFVTKSIINNKRVLVSDETIKIDDMNVTDVTTNSMFIKYLVGTNNLDNMLMYAELTNTLYIIFNQNNYHSESSEDNIMEIKLQNIDENMYIHEIYFNKKRAIFCDDNIIKYPFFIYNRNLCKNFYIYDDNSYSILQIFNNWVDSCEKCDNSNLNIFYLNKDYKSIIAEIPIKNNMITPIFSKYLTKIFKNINNICNYIHKFTYNTLSPDIFTTIKNRHIEPDKNKLNMRILGKFEEVPIHLTSHIKNLYDVSKFTRTHINKLIKFKNITYDTTRCIYCVRNGLDIAPPVNTFDETDKIYFEEDVSINEYLKKFIMDNPVCSVMSDSGTFDIDIQFLRIEIEKSIEHINEMKIIFIDMIDYKKIINPKYSVIELIYDNYFYFAYILEIGIYLEQLKKLKIIFSKETFMCNEITEIDQLLKITPFTYQNYLLGCIEIVLGIIIKKEQWEKFEKILENYEKKKPKWQVHHFMMGKGKSSVITPLLSIYNSNLTVNIIVPNHLIKQTIETMFEFRHLFNLTLNIKDDTTVKYEYLMNVLKMENNIYIIDEFDYMCNPLQSNYNLILESKNQYDEQIINDLVSLVYSYINNSLFIKPIKKYSYLDEAQKVLTNTHFIKNVTFGMSKEDNKKRYCIPYARKDSPLEGSSFKSNIITITLTIIYHFENDFILEKNDIYNIILSKNMAIIQRLSIYYLVDINQFKPLNIDGLYTTIKDFDHEQSDKKRERYIIFNEYIKMIMVTMKESTKIENTSFYDIMNMNCEWQVGYSGTVNITIPPYNNLIKYSPEIESDYDEIIGSFFALTGNYPNSINEIHKISNFGDIIDIFTTYTKYNVLIDACALLKDKKNQTVAEELAQITGKRVIYLTENDDKMIYYNDKHTSYTNIVYDSDNTIFYYSQKHIIGIDFKQPNILNGLVLINDSNNYTQIAQAIYRMRKLNRGHISHIGYCGNNSLILGLNQESKENLYSQLVTNDIKNKDNVKDLALLLTFKHFCRKYLNKDNREKAVEDFLVPLYKIPKSDKYIYSIIIKNITLNILKDTIYNYDEMFKQTDYKMIFDITKIHTRIPGDIIEDVNKLYKNMKNMSLIQLVNILYDIGDIPQIVRDFEINTQEEVETSKEQIIEVRKRLVLSDEERQSLEKIRLRFYYNPYSETHNRYYNWFDYNINGFNVIFSTNLLMNMEYDNLSICIVRLSQTNFLIENIYTVEYYYDKLPIYTMEGVIINQFEIPPENLFATDTMPGLFIDLSILFDTNIIIDTSIFCMNNLIGNISSKNNIDFSNLNKIHKKFIFTMLIIINTFMNIHSTASGITADAKKRLLNINACRVRISWFNNAKYQLYIKPIIAIDLNRYTVKNGSLDTKLQYNIDYIYYIYLNNNKFDHNNKDKKHFIFRSFPKIEGGNAMSKEYKKYLKYKYKYIELKKYAKSIE